MTPPDSGEWEVPYYEVLKAPKMVTLPLSLVQRVVDELDKWADYDEGEAHDLVKKLRERMPK